jgi:hypothetical protein
MSDDGMDNSNFVEILLFYLRSRYLSATECLLFLVLCGIAGRASVGSEAQTNTVSRRWSITSTRRSYVGTAVLCR